jgi:hypothetical protein
MKLTNKEIGTMVFALETYRDLPELKNNHQFQAYLNELIVKIEGKDWQVK